ncbi:hypothetical protein EBT16_01895 [bacterium]|nr:hypothetical protein [bacterium]
MSSEFLLDIPTLVRQQVTDDVDSKTWSGHSRHLTVGASEVGQCARRTFYTKQGVEPDPDFDQDWGAAERGNAIEKWEVEKIIKALQAKAPHIKLGWATDEGQNTITRGGQSATPDGIFYTDNGEKIKVCDPETGKIYAAEHVYFECKSIDPRSYDHLTKSKEPHKLQAIQGMDLVRDDGQYFPTVAVIVYVNASFSTQQRMWVIPFDEEVAKNLRDRAEDLMFGGYTLEEPPMAEGKLIKGGQQCEWCPFQKTCQEKELGRVPTEKERKDLSPEFIERARILGQQRLEAKEREEQAKEDKKRVEEEILSLCEKAGVQKIAHPHGRVSVWTASSPPTFNKALMIADGIDVEKYQVPGTRYIRIDSAIKD